MQIDRPSQIVVIDDEKYICNIVAEALSGSAYNVITFSNPEKALIHIKENPVDLILTDLIMGNYNGVQILDTALEIHNDVVVILMTAHPTVETAISVLKKGAYDFMVKPFKLDLLRATVKRGLEHLRIVRDNLHLKGQVEFLKVANAGVDSDHIESFIELAVKSCKKEFSASAVAMFDINPEDKTVQRKILEVDDDKYAAAVSDEDTILKFTYSKSTKPKITKTQIKVDNVTKTRIFISQPIYARRKLYGIINILIISRFDELTSGQLNVLTLLSSTAAATLANFRLYQNLQESYLQAFTGLANAIEARDPYTAGHTDRVCEIAEFIAIEMGWSGNQLNDLRIGCTLHDIGKIGVPDSILNKPGRLTEDEKEKMNSHPKVGLKIIKGIKLFKKAEPYIIAHHEWYNGQGYPRELKGNEIPLEGRLLTVADTFDAIISDRPYRKGRSVLDAVKELKKYSGVQFDPEIVEIFIDLLKQGKIDFNRMYGREEDISCLDKEIPTEMVSA